MSAKHGSRSVQRREHSDSGDDRAPAPGKRSLSEATYGPSGGGGGNVQRKAAELGERTERTERSERASDWSMSDGMMSAMGLGDASSGSNVQRKAVQADGG